MLVQRVNFDRARILVIEQDAGMRAELCRLLEQAEFRPSVPSDDGTPADGVVLAIIGITPGRPPEPALQALKPFVPIIALVSASTWTGFDFFDVANELGAAAVRQRPFPKTALLGLIDRVLPPAARRRGARPDPAGVAELIDRLENPFSA
jgi:hypothetical protein